MSVSSLVDLVIGVTLCECLLLAAWGRLGGTGIALRDVALNIASGLCLMAALRCLAADAASAWVAAWLAAAGAVHLLDLAIRWRRGRATDSPAPGGLA